MSDWLFFVILVSWMLTQPLHPSAHVAWLKTHLKRARTVTISPISFLVLSLFFFLLLSFLLSFFVYIYIYICFLSLFPFSFFVFLVSVE